MLHKDLLNQYQEYEKSSHFKDTPSSLYDPINYILDLGGKKVRPVLCLLGCSLFQKDVQPALKMAFALELFHNFTLLHDDVMDHSEQRRGKATVHKKWSVSTAILSGDEMLIKTCALVNEIEKEQKLDLMSDFLNMATSVCQGQQNDMDFEDAKVVIEGDYLEMIQNKTAVLLALSLKFGAKIGGASESDQKVLYNYALKIGMGFQMMDDYLDCFGNAEFGKKIGGDILEDKKTWLYIKALELASPGQKAVMASWKGETTLQDEKIAAIRSIFVDLHVEKLIQAQIRNHFVSADKELAQLETSGAEHELKEYVQWLSNRVV
jgi:geranylgeranyl diphosphate synthase, type II